MDLAVQIALSHIAELGLADADRLADIRDLNVLSDVFLDVILDASHQRIIGQEQP